MEAFEVLEVGLIFNDYMFDFLCVVSSCTGVSPYHLYVTNKRVHFGGEEMLVNRITSSAIKEVWTTVWNGRYDRRCVGVGHYADFYMNKVGLHHGAVLGSLQAILVMFVPVGRTVESFREQVKLGERSTRETGAIILYDETLLSYWQSYRETEVRGNLMYVKHVSESDLLDSRERLLAGLAPRRRYNTSAMRRRPNSDGEITMRDRVVYKWMAYDLLTNLHVMLGLPMIDERDVDVDERGILRIPILSPQAESGFSLLWLKVEGKWERIRDVSPQAVAPRSNEVGFIPGTEGVVSKDGMLPDGMTLERIVTSVQWSTSGRQYSERIDAEIAIVSPKPVVMTIDGVPYQVFVAD